MKARGVLCGGVLLAAVFACWAGSARAQWISQTIPLKPGWNAVHVEVQPEPALFANVFAGLPVESVWMWNKRFSPIEFEVDPDMPLQPSPHWLVWLPAEKPASFLSQTFRVQANQAYLVRIDTNAAPFDLVLRGRAALPHLEWFPHALNLIGFPVNPTAPPTFEEFFRPTPLVDLSKGFENEVYRVDATGRGYTIVQPYRERLQPSMAYWVKCEGALDYAGPLQVTTEQASGLDFGAVVEEIRLAVANLATGTAYTVTLAQLESETPPAGQPELAGPVPLSYLVPDTGTTHDLVWSNLPAAGLVRALLPGETWSLQFGVRRNDMVPYLPSGTNGAAYQSVLRVTDAAQSLRIFVPVSAEKEGVRRLAEVKAAYDLTSHHADEGLWVGDAVIDEVSCPSYESTNLLPTDSTCKFRLLLHVDATGQVKLLQRVYLAWTGPETNGEYKLYLNEASVPADSPDVKRLSSVAFPFLGAVALTNLNGLAGTGLTNRLGTTLTLRYDDSTNPFRHPYHPLLDNKDWDFEPYAAPVESKTVTRQIALDFGASVFTNGVPDPFYGIQEIGGRYAETLDGLREQPIHVGGAFYLKRVSMVNQLN